MVLLPLRQAPQARLELRQGGIAVRREQIGRLLQLRSECLLQRQPLADALLNA
jgi:hypothetical protein